MPRLVPRPISRRLTEAGRWPLERARSPEATSILDQPVQRGGFEVLDGHAYALLVTFKRGGDGVPTPVWFARDGERLLVRTEADAFKAKRLRRDPRALVAPCGPNGKPLGHPVAARGRVLTGVAECEHARRVIASQWGLERRLFLMATTPVADAAFLELVATDPR